MNWPGFYDNMTKVQLRRSEHHDSTDAELARHGQFLTNVNAIYLDMSPILSLTGALEDSRMLDGIGTLENFVQQTLPVTLDEELDLLGPFSPLEPTDLSGCLELDLDGSLDDAFFASKDVMDSGRVDAVGGPTLAALNYDADALDDLELENLTLPEENNCFVSGSSDVPSPTQEECLGLPPPPPAICESGPTQPKFNGGATAAAVVPSSVGEKEPIEDVRKSALHELLMRCRDRGEGGGKNPNHFGLSSTKTCEQNGRFKVKEEPMSSAENPCHDQRVVPCNRPRHSRLSTSSVDTLLGVDVKEDVQDVDSHDEGFDSDLDDSDHFDFSDADSDNSWVGDTSSKCDDRDHSPKSRKRERFFWQYNLQAKGPKGTRLPLATDSGDPHNLDEVSDPVFSPSCKIEGIKHTGKARRGDGNDLNPNPTKLFHIGRELKKLNKVINDLTPVSELPFNVRPKSRKEKNKLASRACRLKKKAQHEANKLKLYGLDHEHRRLMHVLDEVKKSVAKRTNAKRESALSTGKLVEHCEHLSKTFLKTEVAGHTADFVNMVLDKVAMGISIETIDEV